MRAKRFLGVLVVAFATLAFFASVAAAVGGPRWPRPTTTRVVPKPLPAAVIAPKSIAMLPSSSYVWVQPVWVGAHGLVVPSLSHAITVGTIQPPVWVPIG